MTVDSIKGSLREKGVRLTRQRQILLELIDQTGQHLDAERLFQLAQEKDPKLNRVTVYRTLKMLKAGGLVYELDLMHHSGDQHYYETRLKQEHALRTPGGAQRRHQLGQDIVQVGIEMAEQRPLHRLEHGRRDIAGARAAEQAFRWVENRGEGGHPSEPSQQHRQVKAKRSSSNQEHGSTILTKVSVVDKFI